MELRVIRNQTQAVKSWGKAHPQAALMVARLVVAVAVVLLATPGAWADIEDMAGNVESVATRWAFPIGVLVCLAAGGAIMLGSDNAGRVAGRAIVALIFVALAMLGASTIRSFVEPLVN